MQSVTFHPISIIKAFIFKLILFIVKKKYYQVLKNNIIRVQLVIWSILVLFVAIHNPVYLEVTTLFETKSKSKRKAVCITT